MLKQKIEYGIDLGTTNSAICRFEKGKVRLIKSERLQKDTTPSCIHYTKRGQLLVGDAALSRLAIDPDNTKIEFKRTMGTEVTYFFPNINKAYTSEELSSEILKKLKSYVKDDEFSSVVITVPADFDQVQIQATQKAAELAGFEYCELLQEPIAASLAYLLEEENVGGHWLVFDIGGGTFDVALMNAERGIVKVVDIAGDNYLGGKNMDLLIVDELIIPHIKKNFKIDRLLSEPARKKRLQSIWKKYAEQYKIQLSSETKALLESDDPSVIQDDEGNDIDICVEVERGQFEELIKPLVDRSIDITRKLVARNQLKTNDLKTILLIGGPTYIPYIRDRIQKEINDNINVNIDPMTAVTIGAALYASTKTVPISAQKRDFTKPQLILEYPQTTVLKEVDITIKVDMTRSQGQISGNLFAEVNRSDQEWSSSRMEMTDNKLVVHLQLLENTTNFFTIQLFDSAGNKLPCEPNAFSLLHGFEISNPPLPHDICVEADTDQLGHTIIPLLLKGQKLPAVGKKIFKTKSILRASTAEDVFSIIVREGEMNTRPIRNIMVGAITITGADLSHTVPKDSTVEITIKMDESRRVNVTAYFPDIDETIQNVLETSFRTGLIDQDQVKGEIEKELMRLERIKKISNNTGHVFEHELLEIEASLTETKHLNQQREGDADSGFGIRNRLNELQIRIDDIEKKLEWKVMEFDLNETYKHAKKIVDIFGTAEHKKALADLGDAMDSALKSRHVPAVKNVTQQLSEIRNTILVAQPGFWISILNNINATFANIQWIDSLKAKTLVDQGKAILNTSFSLKDVQRIVRELWNMMTVEEKEKTQKVRPDIPFYKI